MWFVQKKIENNECLIKAFKYLYFGDSGGEEEKIHIKLEMKQKLSERI